MKLDQIIREAAAYFGNIYIEVDTAYETVAIGGSVFMQGDDAAQFISEARDLYNKAQNVTMDECYACVAKPYVECLE